MLLVRCRAFSSTALHGLRMAVRTGASYLELINYSELTLAVGFSLHRNKIRFSKRLGMVEITLRHIHRPKTAG